MDHNVEISMELVDLDNEEATPTSTLRQSEDGRIDIHCLVQMKLQRFRTDQVIMFDLCYIHPASEENGNGKQIKLSSLNLQQLPLMPEPGERITTKLLPADPWFCRRKLQLNLTNVPIMAAGNYAFVAYLSKPGEVVMDFAKANTQFLDCVYFKVQ